MEIYIEPQYPQPQLLVVGNLPITHKLVALGNVMDYDVIVVDPDGDGSSQQDGVPVVTALSEIAPHVRPDTFVVVATHGNYDEAALEQVLKAQPRYVGLVSSRKRFEAVLDYLRSQGIGEDDLKRIKAPAGLDIQAQQPGEIAISILAEIIQHRRNAQGESDWNMPMTVDEAAAAQELAPGTAIDPVCLMQVEIATAKFTYDYQGTTYYFCAPGCKLNFKRNPEAYLHPAVALDPVCGMEVETASVQHTSTYRGRTYYFCGEGCKTEFEQHPDKYVTAMHHQAH